MVSVFLMSTDSVLVVDGLYEYDALPPPMSPVPVTPAVAVTVVPTLNDELDDVVVPEVLPVPYETELVGPPVSALPGGE